MSSPWPTCENCDSPVQNHTGRGLSGRWCIKHLARVRRHGDPLISLSDGGGRPPGHGHTVTGHRTPTYETWMAMRRRCQNPQDKSFHNYGGRGISVCDRWDSSFENFLADMGLRPPSLTLDRIDNDGNYEPGNCRWATAIQQRANQRRRST